MPRVMSSREKRHIFAALIEGGPPKSHPAYSAWRLWRAARAESRDPRLAAEEPICFLTAYFFIEYLDALAAAGDFDAETLSAMKKHYGDQMVRAHRALRHVPATQRHRYHADIALTDVLVRRRPLHSIPSRRQRPVAARRRRRAQSGGRGARAPDGDASGDSDPADEVVHRPRPRCQSSGLARARRILAQLQAEKSVLEDAMDSGVFDSTCSLRIDAVVSATEALSAAIRGARP